MARGNLRIYLGAAPGVGKTFAMLNEAWRRASRGTDVVVGFVETHGRANTAEQIRDLEVIPRKQVVYRGTEFEEMDVDAILARMPAQVLVDELAHTNVPGSRHEKRWQDVEDLLAAGIDVISTVNVQHLESMNDVIVVYGWRELWPTLSPWRAESFALRPMLQMLRIGLPVAFQQWLEITVFAMGGLVIGLFGAVPLAAHEITLNLAAVTFMVPLGVSAAAAAMVGRAIGREDFAAARRDAVAALSVGVGFMALATVAFTILPRVIAGWFAADAATVAFAASLLPIAGIFQIFDGIQCVSAGILRGTGDTRVPMLLHLGGFWGFGIPLCLLLTFTAGLGPKGVWWGFVGALVMVAMLQVNRMRWRLAQDVQRLRFDH